MFRYWPLIDDALRAAAYNRGVNVSLMGSHWNHTSQDMLAFLTSLSANSGTGSGGIIQTVGYDRNTLTIYIYIIIYIHIQKHNTHIHTIHTQTHYTHEHSTYLHKHSIYICNTNTNMHVHTSTQTQHKHTHTHTLLLNNIQTL